METEEIDKLLEKYGKIYQTRTRDFNALTTVHLSENDHTNILCEILNMKVGDTKPFMKSFVQDVLGIDMDSQNFVAKTQEQAISAKGSGFIDLLIESNDKHIIVENKVCGAGDGSFQLARYYFSYVRDDKYFEELIKSVWEEFELSNKFVENLQNQYKEWWKGGHKADKPYLVYLTDVADKEPNENSLPVNLKSKLDDHYIHISYEEDIYDWLKNKVLPKIQYGKTGDAHNSIILYLRELENILGANNSKNEWYISQQETVANIVEDVFSLRPKYADNDDGLYKYWNKIYNQIDSSLKDDAYKDNVILADLRDCILCYRDSIYGKYAPNGWRVYCAPKYITFYPLYWLERFGGSKTSCVHFAIDNWENNGNAKIVLKIHGSACKQYIVKYEDTFNNRKKELEKFKLEIPTDCNSFKDALKKFQKSNHYCFNLEIKLEQMEPSFEWERDSQASDNFFSKFIENDTIKQLVKYIDDNFK